MGSQKDRLKSIRKALGLTQGEFAKSLGISQSTYAHIERGRNKVTLDHLEKMVNNHSVNPQFFLTGEGDMFDREKLLALGLQSTPNSYVTHWEHVHPIRQLKDFGQIKYRKGNLLVPAEAHAGYALEWSQENRAEHLQSVVVPGVVGPAITVEISGDSMFPVLEDGDWVVAEPLEERREVKDRGVYIIVSKTAGLAIKYIKLLQSGVLCIPANRGEYQAYVVPYEEVSELWEVKLRITSHLFTDQLPVTWTSDRQRIERLERFISTIFPDFGADESE